MVFSTEKRKHLLPENRSKVIEKMMLSRVLLLLSIALKLVLSRSPITQHYKLRLGAINNTLLIHNSTAQFASILLSCVCVCVNFVLIMIRQFSFCVFEQKEINGQCGHCGL